MTTVRRIRQTIRDEQAQARAYIAGILSLMDEIPDEAISEIASHLGIALGHARAAVRKRKEERGVPIGSDTRLISPEEMETLKKELNGSD